MSSYRVRVNDAGELVLQVLVPSKRDTYGYKSDDEWRDMKVSDIPIFDPFTQRVVEYQQVYEVPCGPRHD